MKNTRVSSRTIIKGSTDEYLDKRLKIKRGTLAGKTNKTRRVKIDKSKLISNTLNTGVEEKVNKSSVANKPFLQRVLDYVKSLFGIRQRGSGLQ